jgi:hypothetical protein
LLLILLLSLLNLLLCLIMVLLVLQLRLALDGRGVRTTFDRLGSPDARPQHPGDDNTRGQRISK